jgi:hypothetical protein
MKNFVPFILVLFVSILDPIQSMAQQDSLLPYPAKNLIYPNVNSAVLRKANGYNYRFSLGNARGAVQSIYRFLVEVRATSSVGSSPSDWNARNLNYDTIRVAKWASEDSIADIEPNEILTGFGLQSVGLPGIGRYWVRAWETVKGREGQYEPSTANIFLTHLRGITLSPSTPPLPFMPSQFFDTLLSYTRQSAELGWLAPPAGPGKRRDDDCDDDERPDDGITKNIEQRLLKAKRELLKRDSVQARKELEKLVQKVERIWKRSQDEGRRQKGKGRGGEWGENSFMTSEAYALLKYNTEYLIERLPERSKRGRGDQKPEKQ